MQELMILRHAKAVPWRPGVEDFPRALSTAGREHAERVAEWLCARPLQPEDILCSPAQRTRETLAPLLALRPQLESCTRFVPQIYGASSRTLSALLDHAFAERDRVMIVGHNPGFETLAFEVLASSERDKFERLPTGTLLVVEFENGWPDDCGRGKLTHFVRGKKL
jgi:phosphohistidine phosphatase SixA